MEAVRRTPIAHPVCWAADPYQLLRCFDGCREPVLLESGTDPEGLGRYSILCCDPFAVFESRGDKRMVLRGGMADVSRGDPLEKLRELLAEYTSTFQGPLPFYGGAAGYFSYDLKDQIERLPQKARKDIEIPDIHLGLYHWAIVVDHLEQRQWITVSEWVEEPESLIRRIEDLVEARLPAVRERILAPRCSEPRITSNMTRDEYLESIRRVREYIRSGDIYQANFTQRFQCPMEGTAIDLFGKLRQVNPAPFSAYLDIGSFQVASASPERFIKVTGGEIETRPIKGTRPRGKTPEEDAANREELINSEKDRSELLMIVDLERNDLSRVAEPGTVKVTELFKLETYATVFHLVATVTARLRAGMTIVDCIRATFPGGSITGAPKIRAMEVIDELEPTARNLYTGSIGYIGFNGNSDLNIVIRTILCKEGSAWFQTGGGIVWDSEPELEFEECLHKARGQIRALSL